MASNPYYGQDVAGSISALGKLFEPVSGTNAYGYTKAASERANMERVAELYNMSKSGNLTPEQMAQLDRSSVIAGLYAPTQSYYNVDQGNATSRANNAADNAQRAAANTADNATKMATTRYGAISEGAVLPEMPKSVADLYNLPASPSVSGTVKLSDGQTAFTPSGDVMRGQVSAKPGEIVMPPVMGAAPTSVTPASEPAQAAPQAAAQPTTPQSMSVPLRTGNPFLDALLGTAGVPSNAKIMPPEAAQPGPQPPSATAPAAAAAPQEPYGVNSVVKGGPSVGRGGQSEYAKIQDRKFAEMDAKIFETAQTSFANQATIQRMSQLLSNPNLDTGALANTALEARKVLGTLGVDTGDMSDAETLRALGRSFALKLRDPSQGAGMPGALSDSDRMFLSSMAPGLENTIEGNKKLVDYYSRVNQRNIDIEKMRQAYVARVGRTDEGFRAEVMQFASNNPLFPEAQGGATPMPQSGAVKPEQWQIDKLKANPSRAADFDAKFGQGAAAMYLGGAR